MKLSCVLLLALAVFPNVAFCQLDAMDQRRPVLSLQRKIVNYPVQDVEAIGLDMAGDPIVQCANLLLGSELQKVPALSKDLDKLRALRSKLIVQWKKVAVDANDLESKYFQRIGKFEGQAPPMTENEVAIGEAIRERLSKARAEFQSGMGELFQTRESKRLILNAYYERYLVPNFGVTAVAKLIVGSAGVWGRTLKDKEDKPLGQEFNEVCVQFENRCYSEFAADYCATLKFAIEKLPTAQKERLVEIIPLSEQDITFTSIASHATMSSYQVFLNKYRSVVPKLRLDAIIGSQMRMLQLSGRVSELQTDYLNMFNRKSSAKQLEKVEQSIIEVQVNAMQTEREITAARFAFVRLIAESDFELALSHPVVSGYCELSKDHMKLIHDELAKQQPHLRKEWAGYMQQGALQAFKDIMSVSDYQDVEEVLKRVEVVDMETYLTPQSSESVK